MNQLTLWDRTEARAARDEAVRTVAASEAPWVAVAYEALVRVHARLDILSSEDVWAELARMGIPRPDEGRAMGPVLKRALREGLIVHHGYTTGTDPRHHGDIQRVYRAVR